MKLLFTALAMAVALGGVAAAQTPIDDSLDARSARRLDNLEKVVKELRAIVFQGRETGAAVVVQPAETQGQINSVTDKLSDLDHTLTRMNGELEVIRHDLDEMRTENGDLRARDAALKEEVNALEQKVVGLAAPPPPPPPQAAAAPAAPPPDEPGAAFAAARTLWQSGDNAAAEAAFRDFTDRFGDGPRGPEGRYYLGKTLMARQAWPEAATADIGAIRGWPQTRWAPDAVLDLSKALVAMSKTADACQTLGELARRYPKASAAVVSGARSVRAQAGCK
ncbi:MAG TPA: tetratricopeptide repeat protein [Caulobacteraceae bacterium]|jgi:tol-pal system protein YbgF|nr:tetratricopeptide repeat protein [Caulobacteraceae bacterium]